MDWLATTPSVHRIGVADIAEHVARSAVQVSVAADLAVNLQSTRNGHAALHLVNYTYDVEADHTTILTGVEVTSELPYAPSSAQLFVPGREPQVLDVDIVGQRYHITLPEFRQYALVEFLP